MNTTRRRFLKTMALALPAAAAWPARPAQVPAPYSFDPSKDIILAPDDPALWPQYRGDLARWREQIRAKLDYNDVLYRRPEFQWSAANYCCGYIMAWDRQFLDPLSGRYTVDAFLNEGQRNFGGYDSVVLWQAYPRIGVDDRNQFDFYRDLPGGLRGLRAVVRRCHERGVRVYIDYNPWDTGTRREPKSDIDTLVDVVKALEADGIFLDTLEKGGADFRAKLDAARPGVILEGELAIPLENLADHHASWAQWFDDSRAPGVLRAKWVERCHMQHVIRRWDHDHSGELHCAWMNGTGIMVWENVFGSEVPWNPRDRSILRAMLPVQRRFNQIFSGESWMPLVPVLPDGVFASLWEGDGLRLWTLVNRNRKNVEGPLLSVPAQPGQHYFDLVAGNEIRPMMEGGDAVLSGSIPARGIGCFLSGPGPNLGKGFEKFLRGQSRLNANYNLDSATPKMTTMLVAPQPGKIHMQPPAGMVEIPAATLNLGIDMRVRECGFYNSTPPTGDIYNFQLRHFHRTAQFSRFAMDETPVTNAQFAEFLKAARYRPAHRENFLKHWENGGPPAGSEDHPVVYVDLDDARAYARWAGKRLPTEEEWQYAAQGPDGRKYPWGNEWETGRCNNGETGATTSARAFPTGKSPFGCQDMCGNVWHWTESERSDGRTRFCIIRGGAFFAARGSYWYVDGGPRPANFATKFILAWPGLDRCATIGFRCAADLAPAS
jgi:formylglycine-generating enzyme required for sulfatase activity